MVVEVLDHCMTTDLCGSEAEMAQMTLGGLDEMQKTRRGLIAAGVWEQRLAGVVVDLAPKNLVSATFTWQY